MKKLLIMAAAAVMSSLAACGGGGGDSVSYTPPPIVAAADPGWGEQVPLPEKNSDYMTVSFEGASSFLICSNVKNEVNLNAAILWCSSGDLRSTSPMTAFADFGNRFLRTHSIAIDPKTGECYGIFNLTDIGFGYGGSSYYPWFGTSTPGCKNWKLSPSKLDFINSSANASLTANGNLKGAPVDHSNPWNNAFVFVTDGVGVRIAIKYSSNGIGWDTYKESGKVVDLIPEILPTELSGLNAQFPTHIKDAFGVHLIVADFDNAAGSAKKQVHLWSCYGKKFRVMSANSPTFNNRKGSVLFLRGSNVAATNGTGRYLEFPSKKFDCANGEVQPQ